MNCNNRKECNPLEYIRVYSFIGHGTIMDNVVYNTRGYVVDQANFLFSGNSWGIPQNAVDIALLAGTTTGAPYDPLSALQASNSNATISDQR